MSLIDYGLSGSDHIGLTVRELDEAVKFFTEVIGCEFIFDGGSYSNDPKLMTESLNVNPKASLRYCFLRCKNGSNLELFEYKSPDQKQKVPKNSDVGGHHLALYIDDIYAAVKFLKSKSHKAKPQKLLLPVDRIKKSKLLRFKLKRIST